jgi:hypothetical protein
MRKSEKPENDIGPNPDSKKNLSLVTSQPKKTKSKSGKDQETTDPLKNGSVTSETQRETPELSETEAVSGSSITRQRKKKSLLPVPKLSALESRTLQALKRLKVKPEALIAAPQITPLLKTSVKGGLKASLGAMRFATDDQDINAFLKVYDKVPIGDRERVTWEAIAIAAKVNPKHLLGAIQLAVQTYCWNRSRFIAVSNHPDITNARVKYAMMAGGEKDRTALDIALGVLQSPKGPTFIGKQVAVFSGGAGQAKEGDEGKTVEAEYSTTDGFDDLFPSPNEIQDKLVPIRQRLLEASSTKGKVQG